MGDKKEEEKKDERLEFILQYLVLSRNLDPEIWEQMLENTTYKALITRFFSIATEMILVLQLIEPGLLEPYLEITQPKGEFTFFSKKQPEVVTEINVRDVLIPGNMAGNPIEELSLLVEKVYIHILSNPKNHTKWPIIVQKDVKKHIHDLRSLIWQVKGKINGQIVLPMPMDIEQIFHEEFTSGNLELKSNIEEIVIKWATQINEILDEETVDVTTNGDVGTSELLYWKTRLEDMESVYLQLKDPRVKRMDYILESSQSPYSNYFKDLTLNVGEALIKTRDISLYLKPLEPYFEEIENLEFNNILLKLKALLHCVCLTWANSKYYPIERMIALLCQISNLIIRRATKYIDEETLFQENINEIRNKISDVTIVFESYQQIFKIFQEKIESYFKPPTEAVPWEFHEKSIFNRVYMFLNRLKEIESLLDVVEDYVKLEKLEMAGLKGKLLISKIRKIHEEFLALYHKFSIVPYKILDPKETNFTEDLENFFTMIEGFDRRLATIFEQAFFGCDNMEMNFKMIWMTNSLVNRPIIEAQISQNYLYLVNRIKRRLDLIKSICRENFNSGTKQGSSILDQYLPPVAGALCSLMKLRESIRFPVQCAEFLDHPLIISKLESDVYDKFYQLQTLINEKETEIFGAWVERVPMICETHLSKTLFKVGEDKLLESNFNRELSATLKEIRYMKMQNRTDFPQEAIDLYNNSQFYFSTNYDINLIVNWYNQIRTDCLPVEFALIEKDIEEIEETINDGQEKYTWTSPEVTDYIEDLLKRMFRLYLRVFRAQENLKIVCDRIYSWAMLPVLHRKDLIDENLLEILDKEEKFEERIREVEATAEQLDQILQENYKLIFNLLPQSFYKKDNIEFVDLDLHAWALRDLDSVSEEEEYESIEEETVEQVEEILLEEEEEEEEEIMEEATEETEELRRMLWIPYLSYVDHLISKGLIQAVSTSVCYILDETDPEADIHPLFEIEMHLENSTIVFRPTASIGDPEGFYKFFETLLLDMLQMGTLIPRVHPEIAKEREHYGNDLIEEKGIVFMLEEICNRAKEALIEAREHPATYDSYSWIWLNDRQKYLNYFLEFSCYPTREEREILEEIPRTIPETLELKEPLLSDYKREIDYFVSLYEECNLLDDEIVIYRWLRLNLKNFKQCVLNCVCKWGNILKEYLTNQIIDTIRNYSDLMDEATENFLEPVLEDDYAALIKTMSHLKKIRDRQFEVDDMIAATKEKMDLLQLYQTTLDQSLFDFLEELPEKWEELKKLAAQAKQNIQSMLVDEIELLKKRLNYHDFKQKRIFNALQKKSVFRPDCENPYKKLDKLNKEILDLEAEHTELCERANIFEQTVPEFKHVPRVRQEVKALKALWDYVHVIRFHLDEWKKQAWQKIDVKLMEQDCNDAIKEMEHLDQLVQPWELYKTLEYEIRYILESLEVVSEQANPALRPKQWRDLMEKF